MASEPDHVARPRVYDELQASARSGVDPAAVAGVAPNYQWIDGTPRAIEYEHPDAVRLLCTAIAGPEGGDALRDAAASACRRFVDALPEGYRVYENPPRSYHSTIFHTGCPPACNFRRKDANQVVAELATARALVAATPALEMVVDRVVLASSGVLLVLLAQPGGGPSPTDELRVRCRDAFRDAPSKQATHVMHVSLCRVIALAPENSQEEWTKVMRVVDQLSDEMRGTRATLRTVWHVQESRFATAGDVEAGCVVTNLPLAADQH